MSCDDEVFRCCTPNCIPEDGNTEMCTRCECWYYVNAVIRLVFELISFGLLCALCGYSDTYEFGENIFRPILLFSVASTVCLCIWVLFELYQISYGLRPAAITAATAFDILAFIFIVRATAFTTDKYVKDAEEFAFFNWRVDIQFLRFQSNHGCEGLLAANDTCEICCDEDFHRELHDKLKNFQVYGVCITLFLGYTLFAISIPDCIMQIICE